MGERVEYAGAVLKMQPKLEYIRRKKDAKAAAEAAKAADDAAAAAEGGEAGMEAGASEVAAAPGAANRRPFRP